VSTLGGFVLMLALLVNGTNGRAGDDFKVEEGFVSLFNGKDLTGWYYRNTKEKLDNSTTRPKRPTAESRSRMA